MLLKHLLFLSTKLITALLKENGALKVEVRRLNEIIEKIDAAFAEIEKKEKCPAEQ